MRGDPLREQWGNHDTGICHALGKPAILSNHPHHRRALALGEAKQPSQPSSLMRAVSSLTLSVGVYASKPQIFRKSFTA